MEQAIEAELRRVDAQGGMVRAVESGWVQREIHREAYRQERERQTGARVVVGVNRHVEAAPWRVAIHRHAEEVAGARAAELAALRAGRDARAVARALGELETAARGDANLLPVLVRAVETYATVGEMFDVLRGVFGEYRAVQAY